MKVGIVGAGRVGIISGIALFERGHDVTLVDVDRDRVRLLRDGQMPYFEPDAAEALREAARDPRWKTADDAGELVACEAVLIAVPTPPGDQGEFELGALAQAVSALRRVRQGGGVAWRGIFLRSTVLPGTTERLIGHAPTSDPDDWLGPAGYLPEFLREGTALADAREPDRIVVGAACGELYALARDLFGDEARYLETDIRTAELIKTVNNALLSTCISFANEIARLAEVAGANAADVFAALHLDRRLRGSPAPGIVDYLQPGPGFGGSCLRKDVTALAAFARTHHQEPRLLDAALQINATQPEWFVDRIDKALGTLTGRRVLILGLAFKPGTDDSRESVTLPILQGCARRGAILSLHDPRATASVDRAMLEALDVTVVGDEDLDAAFDASEAVILVTPWPAYLEMLPPRLARRRAPLLFADSRGILRGATIAPSVTYLGIGGDGRKGERR